MITRMKMFTKIKKEEEPQIFSKKMFWFFN